MRHTGLIVATMLATVPVAIPAQSAIPIGARISSDLQLATPRPDTSGVDRRGDYRKRVGPALIGGAVGALALGGVAGMAMSGCTGGDRCDGSVEVAILAGMLGAIVGSAYGAAVPEGRGRCTRTQRFGIGLGGAFLGLAGALVPPLLLATVPMGSAYFLRNC